MKLFFSFLAGAVIWAQGDASIVREKGWRALLDGKDLHGWHAKDPAQPHQWFTTTQVGYDAGRSPKTLSGTPAPGGVIVNGPAGKTQDLVTDARLGDIELYVEWMVPQGSNSGVYLQGLYEVQVFDSFGKTGVQYSDAGGIYHRWINNQGVGGSAPRVNASRRPGEWQWFRIRFRAPRFDAAGGKVENAKFLEVVFNGQVVQENVEVVGGTRAHLPIAEAAQNPLMLQGDHGPVAYRRILWRPLAPR